MKEIGGPKKSPSFEDLQTTCSIFKSAEIEFALGGSGLIYALGLTETVHDWDITTEVSRTKIEPLLIAFEYHFMEADELYATKYRCKFKVGNSNIDLMGGFAIKTSKGIHNVATIVTKHWHGVPLGSPEEWAQAYKLMGRSEKAALGLNYKLRCSLDDY